MLPRITNEIERDILTHQKSQYQLCLSLHDEDIPTLIKLLNLNKKIKYLNLSSNKIREAGAILLGELKHLIHINLANNNISNRAVIELMNNQNLISLDLSGNILLDDNLGNILLEKQFSHVFFNLKGTRVSIDIQNKIEARCIENQESIGAKELPKNTQDKVFHNEQKESIVISADIQEREPSDSDSTIVVETIPPMTKQHLNTCWFRIFKKPCFSIFTTPAIPQSKPSLRKS